MTTRSRDYAAEYRARRARAERRGLTVKQARGHGGGVRRAQARLRSEAGLKTATGAQLRARSDALEALRRLRSGDASSVTDAERQLGLSRGSLRQSLPTAFDERGRVKPGDREAALMNVVGTGGSVTVVVRGNRQRQLAGQHRAAVLGVLAGDLPPSALERFRNKKVAGIELVADINRLRVLDELGQIEGGPYAEVRVA